jgi:hypothetical protein
MNKVSDQQVKEGEELLIDFKALDIDGDEVTYQVNGLPLGAEVIDVSSGVSQLSWTPTFTASTGQALEVTVSALDPKAAIKDGLNSHTFKIEVVNVNQVPELVSELQPQQVEEGEAVQFAVEFVDPDLLENPDEKVELKLESPVEGAELISSGPGKGTFRWQTDFESGALEAYDFKILAIDNAGEEATAPFQVVVGNVNRDPEFGAIEMPAQVIEEESVAV